MNRIPFVVGQWVRGKQFYGRAAQIDEILTGPRDSVWLLGTRRIGKTSLLKQLEHLTASDPDSSYFPLFWDLQGTANPEELHLDFQEALLDAEERLEELDIEVDDLETDDAFKSLGRLRRALRSRRRKLLLLCDEAEELIALGEADPALLRKMRRATQSHADVRAVIASTIRLWALAGESTDTSPFLHGFAPPIYIQRLTRKEAADLVIQAALPDGSRPGFSRADISRICEQCDNHPYLLQLVSKRFLELGDLNEAIEQVSADRMVNFFFSVDFDMLSSEEQLILKGMAGSSPRSSDSLLHDFPRGLDTQDALQRLESLGYLRRDEDRRYVVSNAFIRRWLRAREASTQSPATEPSDPSAEETLQQPLRLLSDRYQLMSKIGEGAMGQVYKAFDTVLRSTIAVKILKPDVSQNEELSERFRQEILLSRDIGHPNILRVYHLGSENGQSFLTMAWINGTDLGSELAGRGRFEPEEVAKIGAKIASALAALHRAGVLHRDVKLQNILVDREQEPFVSDFGLAYRQGGPNLTQDGAFLGTPNYASPEQAELAEIDERSDLYSLGVVLFAMLTGRLPFTASSSSEVLRMHRFDPMPDLSELVEAPEPLLSTIGACLEKDRSQRPQSGEQLAQMLVKSHRPA